MVAQAVTEQVFVDRAIAAYDAMQSWMHLADGRGLYRETAPNQGNPYAYVWPFSRALLGTLCLIGMPGGQRYVAEFQDRLTGLEYYWDGRARVPAYASYVLPPFGQGGDRYYDDNAWLGLALVQAHRMGLPVTLDRPAQIYRFALSGWDANAAHPRPGGTFWVEQGVGFGRSNHDRGAGATAGNAELGLHLGQADQADAMVRWVIEHLDRSGSGRGPFWNVVRIDGSIDTNLWAYNQGVMVGARVLRYRRTGELTELRAAEDIARQSLQTFGDFTNHPPSFNAMLFQNLFMLANVSEDHDLQTRIRQAAVRYADWTWNVSSGARDPATNLFYFDDGGRPAVGKQPARLQDQGAMVQLYALLSWQPNDYVKLT